RRPDTGLRAGPQQRSARIIHPLSVTAMSEIGANLQAIRRRIFTALRGDDREVRVVAVSKQRPPDAIRAALAAGCADIGESYVQEALPKIAALAGSGVRWHYIGHVQTNKARDIAA